MPDLLDTPIEDPAAPAPDAPPADAAPAAADPAAPAPAADPAAPAAEPTGIETLPDWAQKEIRSIRDENAKYRTTAKPLTEAFGKYDDASREVLLDLINTIAADPTAGAAKMRQLSDPEAERPLTRAEFEKELAAREQKKADEARDAGIRKEAEDLGYTFGTRAYYNLLFEAANNPEHKADLGAAHKALEAERQATIDAYLAEKRGDAEATPTAGSGTGSAPANERQIKTFDDASKSAEERFRAAGLGK